MKNTTLNKITQFDLNLSSTRSLMSRVTDEKK